MLVDPRAPELSINRALSGRGAAVVMIPSSSAALPLPPSLELQVVGSARPVAVTSWIKRTVTGSPQVPAVQELPLALYLVGARPPADEGRLAIALAELTRVWRAAGVEVREVARARLDSGEGARLERVEVDPQLGSDSPMVGQLLRLSQGPELALFVVGDVALGGGRGGIWALSGSVPVPPAAATVRSGVVLSGVLVARDPRWAGQVAAHELGHALGLFHTTERTLASGATAVHDQLEDTPGCPAAADRAPRDGTLDDRECAAHDAGNLMFWATVRDATHLTPAQGEMARRSALTR